MFLNYMEENNLNRLALVGTNSQGKTYMISQEFKAPKSKKAIIVANEVKADENIKNSTDSSTLITWLNSLLDNKKALIAIQEEIDKVNLDSINENSFLNISLNSNMESYKGIISAKIETNSNQWKKPGSGEKFLGQLLLISKILEDNSNNNYEYLVIDEPEQHLHPSLYIKVAKILNKISKQGIKVIIATHSPVITQHFIDDTNEICKVIDGNCKFIPSLKDLIKASKEFDCYISDDLKLKDYNLIENKFELYYKNFVLPIILKSLFCNCILLGEGSIERKIFELYMLKYGSSMEKNDIEYAIVDGKIFFPIIINTLTRIGVSVLTLYDFDTENQPIHAYLNRIIEELSTSTISFKPKIENRLEITKEMYNEKYRGLTILINEFYINDNDKLLKLLEEINNKLNEIKQ